MMHHIMVIENKHVFSNIRFEHTHDLINRMVVRVDIKTWENKL